MLHYKNLILYHLAAQNKKSSGVFFEYVFLTKPMKVKMDEFKIKCSKGHHLLIENVAEGKLFDLTCKSAKEVYDVFKGVIAILDIMYCYPYNKESELQKDLPLLEQYWENTIGANKVKKIKRRYD